METGIKDVSDILSPSDRNNETKAGVPAMETPACVMVEATRWPVYHWAWLSNRSIKAVTSLMVQVLSPLTSTAMLFQLMLSPCC